MNREALTNKVIGVGIDVHKQIGPGYAEKIYQRAFVLALKKSELRFEREKRFGIHFEGKLIGYQTIDFLIEKELVVELKAQESINNYHIAQTLSYLKATKKKLGLVLNFGQAKLEIKRVIL